MWEPSPGTRTLTHLALAAPSLLCLSPENAETRGEDLWGPRLGTAQTHVQTVGTAQTRAQGHVQNLPPTPPRTHAGPRLFPSQTDA